MLWNAEGKPLPSELRREEAELRRDIELEDDNTAVPRTHIDDEYAHAGEIDPQVLSGINFIAPAWVLMHIGTRRSRAHVMAPGWRFHTSIPSYMFAAFSLMLAK